jgi:hypothetical protein
VHKLDPVLSRHLGEVRAPADLWDRIQHPGMKPSRSPVRTPLYVLVAVMLAAAAAWSLLPRLSGSPSAQELALQALARSPEDLEFRADEVNEIRDWVKSRTSLDIPLPERTPEGIRLTGACAVKNGSHGVEVAYCVRGHNAALLVSKASPAIGGDRTHRFLRCEAVGGRRISSWIMRGQLYTLAYAVGHDVRGDVGEECLLCHSGVQHLTFLN